MARLTKQNAKRLVMVEGPDDQGVVVSFLNHGLADREILVIAEGGYESLSNTRDALLVPGIVQNIIGVVVDADQDVKARWASLRDRLVKAGYTGVSQDPDPQGSIVEALDLPKLGVWLMPDNSSGGMIEDFMTFLIPPDDPLFEHARTVVANLPATPRRFPANRATKALIHTWLAWQEEPGKPMGQAITKKFFVARGPHFDSFLSWMKRLFG